MHEGCKLCSDKDILNKILKINPELENDYLKKLIKLKDIQIKDLQNELRIRELAEIAAMKCESGLSIRRAVRQVMLIAMKEGIL